MIHPPTRALVGLVAAGLLLTGCTSDADPVTTTSQTGSPSPSTSTDASATPSPSSTLTAEEQQAVDEATEAVRAYKQTFYEILGDPEPNLNEINNFAARPALDIALKSLQEIVATGRTTVESTGPVKVISVEPLDVNINGNAPAVVLLACVDSTAASGTEDGKPWSGAREATQYTVVKAGYLPAPGWAVAKINPPTGRTDPQPC